ncbi:MAG: isocitrate/isopropylmalate dehydrogenase family protein [Halobacteriales archaeon]
MAYDIATLPGDGIGPEVIDAAMPVLETVADQYGFTFETTSYPWNSRRYLDGDGMMPADALDQLAGHDAILLGAIGHPEVPDHVTLNELLLPIRKGFDQQVCRRPSVLFEGVQSPLRGYSGGDIDFEVFRENTEGEYADVGGREHRGFDHEIAIQAAVFTRAGTEAIVRAAFDRATERASTVTNVTKSNAQAHSMVFWDDVVETVAADYPEVAVERLLVDAAAMDLIRRPDQFDVIVASNLFGDILTDIGAIITGSMGLAPSGNLNVTGEYPSMFEPVHGSAPDIAGDGIANPLAAVLSGAMMFDHLGETGASDRLWSVVEDQLADLDAPRTPDLGGDATTTTVVEDLIERLH